LVDSTGRLVKPFSCFLATGKLLDEDTSKDQNRKKNLIKIDKNSAVKQIVSEVEQLTKRPTTHNNADLNNVLWNACERAALENSDVLVAFKPVYLNFWNAYVDTLDKTTCLNESGLSKEPSQTFRSVLQKNDDRAVDKIKSFFLQLRTNPKRFWDFTHDSVFYGIFYRQPEGVITNDDEHSRLQPNTLYITQHFDELVIRYQDCNNFEAGDLQVFATLEQAKRFCLIHKIQFTQNSTTHDTQSIQWIPDNYFPEAWHEIQAWRTGGLTESIIETEIKSVKDMIFEQRKATFHLRKPDQQLSVTFRNLTTTHQILCILHAELTKNCRADHTPQDIKQKNKDKILIIQNVLLAAACKQTISEMTSPKPWVLRRLAEADNVDIQITTGDESNPNGIHFFKTTELNPDADAFDSQIHLIRPRQKNNKDAPAFHPQSFHRPRTRKEIAEICDSPYTIHSENDIIHKMPWKQFLQLVVMNLKDKSETPKEWEQKLLATAKKKILSGEYMQENQLSIPTDKSPSFLKFQDKDCTDLLFFVLSRMLKNNILFQIWDNNSLYFQQNNFGYIISSAKTIWYETVKLFLEVINNFKISNPQISLKFELDPEDSHNSIQKINIKYSTSGIKDSHHRLLEPKWITINAENQKWSKKMHTLQRDSIKWLLTDYEAKLMSFVTMMDENDFSKGSLKKETGLFEFWFKMDDVLSNLKLLQSKTEGANILYSSKSEIFDEFLEADLLKRDHLDDVDESYEEWQNGLVGGKKTIATGPFMPEPNLENVRTLNPDEEHVNEQVNDSEKWPIWPSILDYKDKWNDPNNMTEEGKKRYDKCDYNKNLRRFMKQRMSSRKQLNVRDLPFKFKLEYQLRGAVAFLGTLRAFANQTKMTNKQWSLTPENEQKQMIDQTKTMLARRHVFVGTLRGSKHSLTGQYEFLSISDYKDLEPNYRSWNVEKNEDGKPTQRIVALGSAANVYVY